MSISTDGEICFGILTKEEFEFPWDADEYDGDIEKWWIYKICGHKNPFEIYDDKGNYLDGEQPSEDKIFTYHKSRREYLKENPLPVELVNYCSADYPMYLLSVPKTSLRCERGYPTVFDPNKLVVSREQIEKLVSFCKKYCSGGEYDSPLDFAPKWYLTSYWG